MIALKTSEPDKVTVDDAGKFLADYGARLLASGATCARIDMNVNRIARSLGMDAEMTVMPRHIHITVTDRSSGVHTTSIASVPSTGISFTINTELSRLSWLISDGKLNYSEALETYNKIIREEGQKHPPVILLVTLANASFCRLFGGDAAAMIIVGAATFAGYYTKEKLLARGVDIRIVFLICAFLSSVLGATDFLFSLGATPEIALGTSVLYLIPGIAFLNSFSDMLYRRYLCAFARLADALILTCCLSIGMYAGTLIMRYQIL